MRGILVLARTRGIVSSSPGCRQTPCAAHNQGVPGSDRPHDSAHHRVQPRRQSGMLSSCKKYRTRQTTYGEEGSNLGRKYCVTHLVKTRTCRRTPLASPDHCKNYFPPRTRHWRTTLRTTCTVSRGPPGGCHASSHAPPVRSRLRTEELVHPEKQGRNRAHPHSMCGRRCLRTAVPCSHHNPVPRLS